ncbi:hypothetical protein DZB54_09535 [Herbaspirillum sp. 3R-3a1]|nr:hypothetical protein DZB54_09535 [Herbaspirillum sp. 3R-3a1]
MPIFLIKMIVNSRKSKKNNQKLKATFHLETLVIIDGSKKNSISPKEEIGGVMLDNTQLDYSCVITFCRS